MKIKAATGGTAVTTILFFCLVVGGLCTPTTFIDNPQRPQNSARIAATSGTIEHYELIETSALVSPRMVIDDERSGRSTEFSLSYATTIDGAPLHCSPAKASPYSNWIAAGIVSRFGLCGALPPQIILGKTRVAILYWLPLPSTSLIDGGDANPRTDAIWLLR